MKKKSFKLPHVSVCTQECDQLNIWTVDSPSCPSFSSPNYENEISSNDEGAGDLVFDGIEIATNNHGNIIELGFMGYGRKSPLTLNWPRGACGNVILTGFTFGETVFLDETDDQDIFYDSDTKVIKWTFDKNRPSEQIIRIAVNVAVGICEGELNEIWGLMLVS